MRSLDAFCEDKLAGLQRQQLRRALKTTARQAGGIVLRHGVEHISFSCNDYLALTHHPKVKAAAQQAVEAFGTGAGASRLVTGHHPLLEELERRLAALKGTEACLTFGSGYLTNTGVIPALAGPEDLILVDELAHACLWAGARSSRARIEAFPHNDVAAVRRLLLTHRGTHPRCLILAEGVFSMDGDRAPLADLAPVAEQHDAWLLVDDAHATGVLADGAGSAAAAGDAPVPLKVGTLSKALASYGGFLCASAAVVDLLTSRARTLVYSTGLPPAAAAAAIAALDVIAAEPERCRRPVALAERFCARAGLPSPSSAVVPVVIGEAGEAMEAMRALEAQQILAVAIRPPTVPDGTARLRFAFCADHREEDVDRAADAVLAFTQTRPPARASA
jgi:8-amino-7-oxononanoate synthase